MHFKTKVALSDSKGANVGQPSQVYLAFKKIDSRQSEQLQINAQATFVEKELLFRGTVDFSDQFDFVNGKYSVKLVAIDPSAAGVEVWDLGTIDVWFKEGQAETNNQRMKANYFPQREIIAQFQAAN